MTRTIAFRLLQSLAVLLVMSFVVYGLMGLMPGDPIDLMIAGDPHLSAADAVRLKALYGLDRPWTERWLRWLAQLLQGELGYSRLYARPVVEAMGPALLNTALLMAASLAVALVVAGVLSLLDALGTGMLPFVRRTVYWIEVMEAGTPASRNCCASMIVASPVPPPATNTRNGRVKSSRPPNT